MAKLFHDSIPFRKECGVYAIVNRLNGKMYVGSTTNLRQRKSQHRHAILFNRCRSQQLRDEVIENPDAFEIVLIEVLSDESQQYPREQFWISFYKSSDPNFGYNNAPLAGLSKGLKWSDEKKRKRSVAMTGIPLPQFRKPIVQMQMDGTIIRTFESLFDASRSLGFDLPNGNISGAAVGKKKSAYGYKWAYANQ